MCVCLVSVKKGEKKENYLSHPCFKCNGSNTLLSRNAKYDFYCKPSNFSFYLQFKGRHVIPQEHNLMERSLRPLAHANLPKIQRTDNLEGGITSNEPLLTLVATFNSHSCRKTVINISSA